jgi:hypothetical protein
VCVCVEVHTHEATLQREDREDKPCTSFAYEGKRICPCERTFRSRNSSTSVLRTGTCCRRVSARLDTLGLGATQAPHSASSLSTGVLRVPTAHTQCLFAVNSSSAGSHDTPTVPLRCQQEFCGSLRHSHSASSLSTAALRVPTAHTQCLFAVNRSSAGPHGTPSASSMSTGALRVPTTHPQRLFDVNRSSAGPYGTRIAPLRCQQETCGSPRLLRPMFTAPAPQLLQPPLCLHSAQCTVKYYAENVCMSDTVFL